MDPATLSLLETLARQRIAGDQDGQLATIGRIGLPGLFTPETMIAALCIGGTELGGFIAALGCEHSDATDHHRKALDACEAATATPAPQDPAGLSPDSALVQTILRIFERESDAEALLPTLWHELTLHRQPLDELIPRAIAALQQEQWAAALDGFMRVRARLQDQTPRPVYAHAATCLHHLGRYAEAEALAQEGLGTQRDLIAVKAAPPAEVEILSRWARTPAPVVSILCMAYNHERYIETTLRGFLSQQTTFSFEILIHDDASTDGTQAVIRRWQEKFPSLIHPILQTENQVSLGVRPFELLLRRARGSYVATCEGDDYWIEPTKLQKQVGFLEQHRDFSCSAHNYFLYTEAQLAVRPWINTTCDRILSARQLKGLARLLWVPTLVFRKTFSTLPPERDFAPIGDQFLTSYLGTFGKGIYYESFFGSVRRENQHSVWSPLSEEKKEHIRVKTWIALVRLHENRGNTEAVADLRQKIAASPLDASQKSTLEGHSLEFQAGRSLKVHHA